MMTAILETYDAWLRPNGPVAITVRTALEPVMGAGAVFFPPTFAPAEKGGVPAYVVDTTTDGKVAIIDTVGSQANRLEPLFKTPPYSELVPQGKVQIGDRANKVNVLDAGHRAADALIRFSNQRDRVAAAFAAISERGDSTLLAKLAPTSLVFGVWDSRGIGVKVPRLLGATVRAYGVEELSRAAQFFSSFEKDETEALGESQETLSALGLSDSPAGRGPGGIIARQGIYREAVLNLVAVRALAGSEPEGTQALRRYILGLALTALAAPMEHFLREGCLLVPTAEGAKAAVVERTGARSDFSLDADRALEYAREATAAFGKGDDWEGTFEREAVKAVSEKKKADGAKKSKGKS